MCGYICMYMMLTLADFACMLCSYTSMKERLRKIYNSTNGANDADARLHDYLRERFARGKMMSVLALRPHHIRCFMAS